MASQTSLRILVSHLTGVPALLYLSCVFNFYSIESKLSKINDAYCYGCFRLQFIVICFRVRCWSRARSQWKTSSIWLVMIIIVAGGRLSSRHFTISLYMSAHVLSVSLQRKDIFTIDIQDLTTNYFLFIYIYITTTNWTNQIWYVPPRLQWKRELLAGGQGFVFGLHRLWWRQDKKREPPIMLPLKHVYR